jgi:hypothetical protein
MGQGGGHARGHAFISYVHEDRERDRLQSIFEDAGVRVWRDTGSLWPGQDWKAEIRTAITADSLAFIACFSERTGTRSASYQDEELNLAVEQMGLKVPGSTWLIPVKFAPCRIPAIDQGTGRMLDSLQWIDLFDDSWERGTPRLLGAVFRVLGVVPDNAGSKPGDAASGGQQPSPQTTVPNPRRQSSHLRSSVEASALGTELLTEFLDAAAGVDASVSPLLRRLARRETERLARFMRQLPIGSQIAYDGEDREWLLGLTEAAGHSIDAISLSTVTAGLSGFDGGLWNSDLGSRYLELQREAISRHVAIRRIFIFE